MEEIKIENETNSLIIKIDKNTFDIRFFKHNLIHIMNYENKLIKELEIFDNNFEIDNKIELYQLSETKYSVKHQDGQSCEKCITIEFLIESNQILISNQKNKILNFQIGNTNNDKYEWTNFNFKTQFSNLYGLGEKSGSLNKNYRDWIFWNFDEAAFETETDPLYKSIPFGILTGPSKRSVGILNDYGGYQYWKPKLSNGIISLNIHQKSEKFSFYILLEKDSKHLIELYTSLVGKHTLPPIWALGYHQARWSYFDENMVKDTVNKFRKNQIPLDAIYLDIDYMEDYKCFTWDSKRFPSPIELIKFVKDNGSKVITILDPGIKIKNYFVHEEGIKFNYFLKHKNGKLYRGKVWPGNCHFPDLLNSEVRKWWGNLYKNLLDIGVAGFWNDMNEPAIFDLRRTFPPDIIHHTENDTYEHHNVHNIYGTMMVKSSADAAKINKPNIRVFNISRSAFIGIQKFSSVWTGDNLSNWDHMKMSISKCLGAGLSGISFIGADIGGFRGSATKELFIRWNQLGVFYPLFRNHSALNTRMQEPWQFDEETLKVVKKSIELRYILLPYIYTWVYFNSRNGIPLIRPLFLEYPDDSNCYESKWENTEFFFGPSILVIPIFETNEREFYLPEGNWVNFFSGEKYVGKKVYQISLKLDETLIFINENAIIPTYSKVGRNTFETMSSEIKFNSYNDNGEGYLYIDDGETLNYTKNEYGLYKIKKVDGKLSIDLESGYDIQNLISK